MRFFRRLAPHLGRSLSLCLKMAGLMRVRDVLEQAIDLIPAGIMLTDERGRVFVENRAARKLLEANDGLGLSRDGEITAARPDDTAALRKMLGGAAATGAGRVDGAGGSLSLPRPSGKRPLSVMVAAFTGARLPVLDRPPCAAVLVTDPEQKQETPPGVLSRLFGLTHAEARVASLLAAGRSVAEIGDELAIASNTVRAHLKQIYAKTGTRRQSELVGLLLSSVASLGRITDK
ncbi:MAG: helix-turn-helix transcriptional regulator [Polyangia bacterium]